MENKEAQDILNRIIWEQSQNRKPQMDTASAIFLLLCGRVILAFILSYFMRSSWRGCLSKRTAWLIYSIFGIFLGIIIVETCTYIHRKREYGSAGILDEDADILGEPQKETPNKPQQSEDNQK